MTREEAQILVRGLLAGNGIESEGLDANGRGGMVLFGQPIYFEHRQAPGPLVCSVLLYAFEKEPRPGLLKSLERQVAEGAPTGGGRLDYRPGERALLLTRSLEQYAGLKGFAKTLKPLIDASQTWIQRVLPQAARETQT